MSLLPSPPTSHGRTMATARDLLIWDEARWEMQYMGVATRAGWDRLRATTTTNAPPEAYPSKTHADSYLTVMLGNR